MLLSIILFILFLVIYLISYLMKRKKLIFCFKILTSLSFLYIGLNSYLIKEVLNCSAIFILLGLIFGFLGDVFLGIRTLKQKKNLTLFLLGVLSFTIGHILYISSLININIVYNLFDYLLVILIIIGFISMIQKIKFDFQKSKVINQIYLTICAILFSLGLINIYKNLNKFTMNFFIGITLFIASDFLLCFIYFKSLGDRKTKIIKILNIIFYFFGQAIIAYSVIYL